MVSPIHSSQIATFSQKILGRPMQTLALTTVLLAGLTGGCAGRMMETTSGDARAPQSSAETNAEMAVPETSPELSNDAIAGSDVGEEAVTFVADAPQAAPQLVKRAELSVEVEDMDEAIQQTMAIARSLGGDVLTLQNQMPSNETITHSAFVELRVPQNQLDDILDQLAELGTVERQTLSAEDVSAQLVDFEARLRNLRKAEEMTLGIMERSGEIGEVLQVSQELRNIRASIEQIDGQLSALKTRVSYSTISLNLTRPGAATPSQTGIVSQLGNSWKAATGSMAARTIDVIQLGIWILVYSPYWLAMGAVVWVAIKVLKRDKGSTQESQSQSVS